MNITNKHQIRYPSHIFKEFSKIYSSLGIASMDAEKILNLYKLHNKIANHILSYCFQVEEQLKSDLIEYFDTMKYKNIDDLKTKVDNISVWNRITTHSDLKSKSISNLISGLQLGSLRALINILNIYEYFSKIYNTPSGYKKNLRVINMWRNRLSHGGLISAEFSDEYNKKIKLAKLFTILRKNKGFIKETENILSEYNSNLIGFDVSETVHYLKIQGHMNFINRKKILDIEGFRKYFIGTTFKPTGTYSKKIKTEYASFFGKTSATKYFGEKISINKSPPDKTFRRAYLSYLIYKSANKIKMSKQEKVVFLVLTITKNKQNILYESFEAILEISFIDKSRLTSIIRTLGLPKVKKPANANAKDIALNVLLSNGFILYKKKYLINKKQKILKLTNYPPFYREMKIFDRENNHGRKSRAITINSKQIALHRILAELFVPNPNNYKYVSVKTMNYEKFSISDII